MSVAKTGTTCTNCGAARPEEMGPCPECGGTGRKIAVTIHEVATATASVSTSTKRGPASQDYFRWVSAALLGIVAMVVSFLDAPAFAKIITALTLIAIALALVHTSPRVQNWLVRLKAWHENIEG